VVKRSGAERTRTIIVRACRGASLLLVPASLLTMHSAAGASSFTVDQVLSLPTPDNLVASPVGAAIAWTFNERGVRNVYAADAPAFSPRKLTSYTQDDGQELTQLSFSRDGRTVVYVRGGDHGSNRPTDPPNPSEDTTPPRVQLWAAGVAGDGPVLVGDCDDPAIAPSSRIVACVRDRRIFLLPIDGSKPRQEPAFYVRGTSHSPSWSPDGQSVAFVSNRGDHSFIGLFTPGQPIRFLAPSTSRDSQPVWSLDGRKVAFLRQPGTGGTPRSPLTEPETTWSVLVADVGAAAGTTRGSDIAAATVLTSGNSPADLVLRNPNGIGLQWAADDTLVFLSYRDGFPHLYALQHPGSNGRPLLLTPGQFMVEQFALSSDHRTVVYNANTGLDRNDFERRHLFAVAITGGASTQLTNGAGIEWSPAPLADSRTVAFLGADARRPPLPGIVSITGGGVQTVGVDHVPPAFPSEQLVVPTSISFKASDGVEVHGQLFQPVGFEGRRPAVVYVHGGGPRQMLLGWHYRWEYANDYAMNQYLASRGFVVLAVNYRLSVGYGQSFQFPPHTGARGASEYLDVLAAGRYLQKRPDVAPQQIGIWGASYGGYLTALGLGRNSDVFAAGVDLHGVHDRLPAVNPAQLAHALVGDGLTEADLRQALKVEFESSPIAAIGTWKSPVLLIHGDDDRTVDFRQTIDLGRRLRDKGVKVEELVLPDDVHDPLLWRNWKRTFTATAEFFERTLGSARH
jgi:dipeptidyl aminopeptidase/acylaminoacyl peptidase